MVVILGERPVAARLPGQLGGEGGEDVVEAVAHDHVVVDGNCIISKLKHYFQLTSFLNRGKITVAVIVGHVDEDLSPPFYR